MGKVRAFSKRTGGTTAALDAVASSAMATGDISIVVTTNAGADFYWWNATSTAAESTAVPFSVIRPDDFSQGVHQLSTIYVAPSTVVSTAAGSWDTTPTTAAPVAPVVGHFYWADNDGWDPITSTATESYWALYTTASTYVGVIDGAGNLMMSNIDTDLTAVSTLDDTLPSAKAVKTALDLKADLAGGAIRAQEVNGNSNTTLTTSQLANAVVYNTGQTTADVVLTLSNAGPGLSALFVAGTTVANDWKVRASTSNKIYAIASSDGSILAGATAGYYGFDATTAIGVSFAVWAFRSSTTPGYDWMAKCISGTPSTTAP